MSCRLYSSCFTFSSCSSISSCFSCFPCFSFSSRCSRFSFGRSVSGIVTAPETEVFSPPRPFEAARLRGNSRMASQAGGRTSTYTTDATRKDMARRPMVVRMGRHRGDAGVFFLLWPMGKRQWRKKWPSWGRRQNGAKEQINNVKMALAGGGRGKSLSSLVLRDWLRRSMSATCM